MTLWAPKAAVEVVKLKAIQLKTHSTLSGNIWEQVELPSAGASSRIVNLCNMGPLMGRNHLTLIHDAQVFLSPGSYSKAFVQWYRTALPLLGANSSIIATVSEYSKELLVHYKVAPASKIEVLHNGCDHMLGVTADRTGLDGLELGSTPYFMAFGNLQQHKNFGLVMDMFSSPRLKGARIVVVGGVSAPQLLSRCQLWRVDTFDRGRGTQPG